MPKAESDYKKLSQYVIELSRRKPVRTFKSDKGYDRVRDRKDKRLYNYEEDEDNGIKEKRPSVF